MRFAFTFLSAFVFVLLVLITSVPLYAQKEANVWYFSNRIGLDFNSAIPKVLQNGAINSFEGCASICDKQGKLLFYTDGITVWNRLHQPMPNGLGLKGHRSSTQSALIIPKPGNESIYYLFTADEGGYVDPPNEGIHYNEVNICLANGLGGVMVASKNTLLYKPSTERLAAIYHSNGTDVWLMTHEYKSNCFVAYLITSHGISSTPVVSAVGFNHPVWPGEIDDSIGELKFSPNGKRLAVALNGLGSCQIFDFDISTGKVTNPITLEATHQDGYNMLANAYSVSFSPNSEVFYLACANWGLNQFDLKAGNEKAINQTKYRVSAGDFGQARGLQLGPDGKLYMIRAWEDTRYLGVIEEPNALGNSCRYNYHGVDLGKELSAYGLCLPNFIINYFDPSPSILVNKVCETSSFTFGVSRDSLVQSVSWDFADAASGENNASTQITTLHEFSNPGEYLVKATITLKDGKVQTLQKKVSVNTYTPFSLGKDTTLCVGQTLSLNISAWEGVYRWQDGNDKPSLLIDKPGKYAVEICQGACSLTDTIEVSYQPDFTLDLGADQLICDNKSITLKAVNDGARYLWQDGSTQSELVVSQTGSYSVQVSNLCGFVTDSVYVRYEQPPVINLGIDQEICVGDTLWLKAEAAEAKQYLWYELDSKQDTYAGDQFAITQAGTYVVEAIGTYCTGIDTLQVTFTECDRKIFIPNVITPNGDGKNEYFEIRGIFSGQWSVEIYNKQGKKVYYNPHYQNDWQGQGLSASIYYYYLYQPQSKRNYKGWIQLLR